MMCAKKWLLILLMPWWYALYAHAQMPQVTGLVQDEDSAPLPNVVVTLKSAFATYHTLTDTNGSFNFNSAFYGGPYTIIFSYVGFDEQQLSGYILKPGNLITISAKLKSSVKALQQVVVVGYGTTFKTDISSAVTIVPSSELSRGVITSVGELLQGRVAGLDISKDGNPNGLPMIILRGPSTLNLAQQPFFVIDDVPDADVSLISPDDIMSVEILKDAAATAIYGNRAANGVIYITTRKGRPGNMQTVYSGYAGVQKISNTIEVATASELRDFLKANNKALAPADDNGANTDWQKEVSRTGIAQNHNLSFNGGTDKLLYSGSMNYFKNEAILKKSFLERFTGRITVEHKALNDHVKFKYALYNTISNQGDVDSLVFSNVLTFLPTLNIYNSDGTFHEDLTRTKTYNPLALIQNNQYNTKINTFLGTAGMEARLPFNITWNFNFDYQTRTTNYNSYYNSYSKLAYSLNGEALRSTYQDLKRVVETYFGYEFKWHSNHHFKFLLGYSWQQDDNGDGFQTSNINFPSDATGYYNLGLGQPPPGFVPNYGTTSLETLRLISFYSRINYNYKNQLLFQASLRRDGSSAFGINHRWGYFPSVSAAWRLVETKFIKQYSSISDLKLRLSYGITGNTIGFDPLTPLLLNGSTGAFYYNGAYIKSIGPIQNPNPNLQWEKTGQVNAGLDFGLFNNRVTSTIDVYDKNTTGIIYKYQQPASASYTPGNVIYANAGSMNNRGIEFSLNATPVDTKAFKWSGNLNLAHNRNEVTTLSNNIYKVNYILTGLTSNAGQSSVYSQIIQAGYPVGEFYTLHYLGKNAAGVSMFEDANGKPTTAPKSTDQRYMGDAQPRLVFGFSNSFRLHNWSLDVFLRGVTGNKILNATLAAINSPSDATNHNIPKQTLSESYNDFNANLYSDRYLESGSYLRLDNLTLGYVFNTKSKYVKSIKARLTGTNLFTLTGYSGIDPEMNVGTITPGIDNHNYYPKTRSFIAGLTFEL